MTGWITTTNRQKAHGFLPGFSRKAIENLRTTSALNRMIRSFPSSSFCFEPSTTAFAGLHPTLSKETPDAKVGRRRGDDRTHVPNFACFYQFTGYHIGPSNAISGYHRTHIDSSRRPQCIHDNSTSTIRSSSHAGRFNPVGFVFFSECASRPEANRFCSSNCSDPKETLCGMPRW